MRFHITLSPVKKITYITYNYQYALSAVIYNKLRQASESYATFLHDKGYSVNDNYKHFKLFCFSNFQERLEPETAGLKLTDDQLSFYLGCHVSEFAENLIKGVFMDQHIGIGDYCTLPADFIVTQISAIPDPLNDEVIQKVILKPISPLVVARKNERGNYDYLSPEDPDFIPLLRLNLYEKLAAAYGEESAQEETENKAYNIYPPADLKRLKSRLVTIKPGAPEETRVRGFYNFSLQMEASGKVINMALNGGLGSYNATGFGCVSF